MSKNIDRRLDDLERATPTDQQYEAELLHQLERMSPSQVAHDVAVIADVLRRLPTDPKITAWLNECAA